MPHSDKSASSVSHPFISVELPVSSEVDLQRVPCQLCGMCVCVCLLPFRAPSFVCIGRMLLGFRSRGMSGID